MRLRAAGSFPPDPQKVNAPEPAAILLYPLAMSKPHSQPALSILGLCLLVACSCDESAENRKAGPVAAPPAPAAKKADATPTAPETKPAPPTTAVTAPPKPVDVPGVVKAYSGCYAACFSEKGPATNRETCKLNCDATAETGIEGIAGAPPKDAFMKTLSAFNGCVNACHDDKTLNATNRETCVLTCQDAAEVAAASPAAK